MLFSLIIGFVLGAAAILFAIQNTQVAELRFMGWEFESSLALLVLISLAIGALIALLISIPSMIGDGFRIRRLEKYNQKLAKELEEQEQRRAAAATASATYVVEEVPPSVLDMRNR